MKAIALALTALLSGAAIADDYLIPPAIYAPQSTDSAFHEMPRPVNPNELITVDVLVLYTPGVAISQLGQMMTDANNAYRDSGVNIHLRAIHIQEVAYTAKVRGPEAALSPEAPSRLEG